MEFGLTGGIGSGKSSASLRLQNRGAALVDADAIVRELQRPGQAVFEAMVDHFGDGIVGEDGALDRAGIAAIVFNDKAELEKLNELTHPPVREEMARQRADFAQTHDIVVLDIPLLIESGYKDLAGIVVVDLPTDLAVQRLIAHRGFDEADARARIANQVTREERLEIADFVIDNSGTLADLDAEVDRCWQWMTARSADSGGSEKDSSIRVNEMDS